MGLKCSAFDITNMLHISGNGNSAVIINGVNYNISSILNEVANVVMRKYRSELMLMYFTSVSLVVTTTLLLFQCIMARKNRVNSIPLIAQRNEREASSNIFKYEKHLNELDEALEEIENMLMSNSYTLQNLANPLVSIKKIINLSQSSLQLQTIVISKLVKKNYAGVCVGIFKLKDDSTQHCSRAWHCMTCVFDTVCDYLHVSSTLCRATVDAGIIPVLVPTLTRQTYLDDLDFNPSVMYVFQMVLRILLHVAQTEELKYELEKYNCYEILLNVISHTKNKFLRAICLLTAVRLTQDGVHALPFMASDSTTLFRLYYESVRSKSQEAFGLKQQHILDGIYAIGQLDCRFTHFVHVPE